MEYDLRVSDRIERLKAKREWYNDGRLRLNSERTRIITKYYKEHESEYPILRRAGFLYEWCATREIFIEDEDILLGSTGPGMRTISFNIEARSHAWIKNCLGDSDEKFRAAWQTPGCVWVDDEERAMLLDAAEYWKDRDIHAHMKGFMPPEIYEHFGSGVSDIHPERTFSMPEGHFVANFEKAIKVGFGEVRRDAARRLAELEKNLTWENARSHAFYRAAIKLCDGAILMSKRYAQACRDKAATESDPARKAELLKMADSCDWIMENPARNLWEGLQVIIFYQTIISADGQQHGQSIANVDRYVGDLLDNDIASGNIKVLKR